MDYVRIYTDGDGETHFQDVVVSATVERYASATWLLSAPMPVTEARFRDVSEDYPDTPHVAPRRQLIVGLAGVAEVEVSDGEVRSFGPGSVLLVDDLTGKGHTTRGVGDTPRRTLLLPLPA